MSKYYIICLKHTNKKDAYLTLWRPNNGGYCWFKDNAGVYDGYEKGYHDSCNSIPVLKEKLDNLFTDVEYDGKKVKAVLNNPENRKKLGIRITKLGKNE